MINRRSYLEKLEMYTNRNVVKIISGVRRSGKTTLIKEFIEELKASGVPDSNIIYLNFESITYAYYKSAAALRDTLNEFLHDSADHMYIFLDEAENIDGWASVCSEMMNLYNCEFYVSSSNSSLFKNDFGKVLDYRFVRIDVFPLSFVEYMDAFSDEEALKDSHKELDSINKAEDTDDSILKDDASFPEEKSPSDFSSKQVLLKESFFNYLKRGSMPGVYSIEDENCARDYLNDVYNTIILKDVVQCNNLRDVDHIDRIMEFVMRHIGETYSPKAIKDYCVSQGAVISVDTVYDCLEALTGAFLLNKVPRYDIKASRKLETQEKYYLCDPAMASACLVDEEPSLKAQLENILCNELLSRGFGLYVGKSGRSLVDFMGVRGQDRTYLNVCESIAEKDAQKKAFSPLLRIRDNYFKMVLSLDPETFVNKGGIINYPLIRFLSEG